MKMELINYNYDGVIEIDEKDEKEYVFKQIYFTSLRLFNNDIQLIENMKKLKIEVAVMRWFLDWNEIVKVINNINSKGLVRIQKLSVLILIQSYYQSGFINDFQLFLKMSGNKPNENIISNKINNFFKYRKSYPTSQKKGMEGAVIHRQIDDVINNLEEEFSSPKNNIPKEKIEKVIKKMASGFNRNFIYNEIFFATEYLGKNKYNQSQHLRELWDLYFLIDNEIAVPFMTEDEWLKHKKFNKKRGKQDSESYKANYKLYQSRTLKKIIFPS